MITTIIVISYLVGIVAVIDQVRRPASAWTAADRNRSWWIGTTVVLSLMACGIVIGGAYLLGVVPAFSRHDGVDDAFRKRP